MGSIPTIGSSFYERTESQSSANFFPSALGADDNRSQCCYGRGGNGEPEQSFNRGLDRTGKAKAEELTKQAKVRTEVEKLSLWIAFAVMLVILALAAAAFFYSGERGLFGQAITLVVGFLGGMGYRRVSDSSK